MDLERCVSKVFGSRRYFLSECLWNDWYTIVLIGAGMKQPNHMNYILVECNSFIRSPRQMKYCQVLIYIQIHISEFEEKE